MYYPRSAQFFLLVISNFPLKTSPHLLQFTLAPLISTCIPLFTNVLLLGLSNNPCTHFIPHTPVHRILTMHSDAMTNYYVTTLTRTSLLILLFTPRTLPTHVLLL